MKQTIIFFFLLTSGLIYGREIKTTDFLEEVKKRNISDLWITTHIKIEDSVMIDKQEPLGFIGENYQRFYIHFDSATQNTNNPLEYNIYGKTKVKRNICSFQGRIIISESKTYDGEDVPGLKQGFVKGKYEFYEQSSQIGSGVLTGEFQTNFYIDKTGKLKYDAVMFMSDGFENNQFKGTWVKYKTHISKKCNWGDYRIPESKELDCGAGEFSPVDKYDEFGWKEYNQEIQNTDRKEETWWIGD